MQMSRSSGILLHPSSLPGTPGIGTLGHQAYKFVDWLKSAKQSIWQILPLGPTGYGDSPYASFSTYAGNPLLIDLDMLVKKGYMMKSVATPPSYITSTGKIDYGSVVWWKLPVLKKAAEGFLSRCNSIDRNDYVSFKKQNAWWLDNYAIFMSIKEVYDLKANEEHLFGAMWSNYWPKELASHNEDAVRQWELSHKDECEIFKVIQFFFFSQWNELKKYANDNGISIIGDIPIFVAPDSADVWSNQKSFLLDENGAQTACAGVPPDYFSATGQLWGNPLYNWEEMEKDGFSWWIQRIKYMTSLVDFVRIDHFRGFEAYWKVPAGEKTAQNGEWVKAPGQKLFKAIQKELGDIPLIAEDLGLITPEVLALRDDFDLPGMKILQCAFDKNEAGALGNSNPFMPHMYPKNCVVYTGTHDNATLQGWLLHASEEERKNIANYLGLKDVDVDKLTRDRTLCKGLVRLAMSSVADFAIFPLQDIFSIGDEARMNTPSTTGGSNWQWRMDSEMISIETAEWLKTMSVLYDRNNF